MGRYNIPKKFTEENRILIIFTKKSFVYTAIGSAIGIFFLSVFNKLGHPIIGLLSCFLMIVPFFLFGKYKYPNDSRYNGGEDLDRVVFRKLKKKFNKKIYVSDAGRNNE